MCHRHTYGIQFGMPRVIRFIAMNFCRIRQPKAQVTAVLLALAIGLGPAWAKGLLIPANEAHRGCAHRAPESSDKNIVRTYGGFLK